MIQTLRLIVLSFTFTITAHGKNTNELHDQYQRSIKNVMANMLDNGATVASPSKVSPDYYYDWVRDTSLTMKMVVQLTESPNISAELRNKLQSKISTWINFETSRQQTQTLVGLGEPKFYVSGKANLEPWGRPQNDGPALRALTAIKIANILIKSAKFDEVRARLYRAEIPANSLIKRDLEYIAHHWQEDSFDLWEEERAMHFYTLTVQKVALIKGAELAQKMSDAPAAIFYLAQSKNIENYLSAFIDAKTGIINYAINKNPGLPHKKNPLDIAVLLAAIHTFDGQFYVPMNAMIKTVNLMIQTFNSIYPINQVRKNKAGAPLGIALGRYPDDVYSGFDFSHGNPWFISTMALAEFMCELGSKKLSNSALMQFNRVIYHLNADGSLAEQFNRNNGFQQGARDLTWSYASYITAYRACFK